MPFTEYSYKFLYRPITIRVEKPLETGLLDYIANYIELYKKEITLSNSVSSAYRFNEAPLQFPFAVDTLFLDYLYELYSTFETLNLLDLGFIKTTDSSYDDIVLFDPYEQLVVKKEQLTLKKELLYTSILLGFIHDLLIKHIYSFSLSSGKYFIGKNAVTLEAQREIHNSASIVQEYTFNTQAGFTKPEATPFTKNYLLVSSDLQLIDAFSFKKFDTEELFVSEAEKLGILIQEQE